MKTSFQFLNPIKIVILLCTIFFTAIAPSAAQNKEVKGLVSYGELGGAAWKYSANVEREFLKMSNLTLSGRIGLGVGVVNSSSIKRTFIGVPMGVAVFSGKGKHHPEVGLNVSYVQGRYATAGTSGGYGGNVTIDGDPGKEIFLVPSVGYRFQRPQGGFFAKFLWTPLIRIADLSEEGQSETDAYSGPAYAWVGLSVGYISLAKVSSPLHTGLLGKCKCSRFLLGVFAEYPASGTLRFVAGA